MGPVFDLSTKRDRDKYAWRFVHTQQFLYRIVGAHTHPDNLGASLEDYHGLGLDDVVTDRQQLLGLADLAQAVSSIAAEKNEASATEKILPHLVVHLHAAITSFLVPYGWFLGSEDSTKPQRKLSTEVDPFEEILIFLDCERKRFGHGILEAFNILRGELQLAALAGDDPFIYDEDCAMLEKLGFSFYDCLGEGLHERWVGNKESDECLDSPYLCGAAVVEALVIEFTTIMRFWANLSEPFLMLHVHNSLLKRGYLKQPVGMMRGLQNLFAEDVFVAGKAPGPNSDFLDRFTAAWEARKVRAKNSRGNSGSGNRMFKTQPLLSLLHRHGWDYERVLDAEPQVLESLREFLAHQSNEEEAKDSDILHILGEELTNDIFDGLSGSNLVFATAWIFIIFTKVEATLKRRNNSKFMSIYNNKAFSTISAKRIALTKSILVGRDEECQDIFAWALSSPLMSFSDQVFWAPARMEGCKVSLKGKNPYSPPR